MVALGYQMDHQAPTALAHQALLDAFVSDASAAGMTVLQVKDLPKSLAKTWRERYREMVSRSDVCVIFIFPDARPANSAGNGWIELGTWDGWRGAARLLVVNATGQQLGPTNLNGYASLPSTNAAEIVTEVKRIIAANAALDLAELDSAIRTLGKVAQGLLVEFPRRELAAMHRQLLNIRQRRTVEYELKDGNAYFMERAADAAETSIEAVNTFAPGAWSGPMATYFQANVRAIRARKVKVKRVFVILDRLDEGAIKEVLQTARLHRAVGVEVSFAFQSELQQMELYSHGPLVSCGLFDDSWLGYEVLRGSDLCPHKIEFTWDPSEIGKRSPFPAIYEYVWDEKEVQRRLKRNRRRTA